MVGIKEVAKKAGVSISTVSNVLNKSKYVSPELAKRVEEAVKELQYVANPIARSMKNNKTGIIGVITEDVCGLFYPYVVRGINSVADEKGYQVMLCDAKATYGDPMAVKREYALFQRLFASRVDGIIFASSVKNEDSRDYLEKLQKEVILVTHSRDEAYHMCNDIAVVSRGQIVVHKDTKELFAVPEKIEAAEITGCKNIVAARKAGEHEVLVPEWGNLCFTVKDKVQDSLKAIGIRAHYFNTSTPMNRHGIHIVREMEEPFETILLFRYEGQEETARNVWWRIPKEKRPREFPGEIGIASANILLLY